MSAILSTMPTTTPQAMSRGTLSVWVIGMCLLVLGSAGFGIALSVLAPVVRQLGNLVCCAL